MQDSIHISKTHLRRPTQRSSVDTAVVLLAMSLELVHKPLQLLHVALHIPVNPYKLPDRINQLPQPRTTRPLRNQGTGVLIQGQIAECHGEVAQSYADLGLVLRVGLQRC